MADVLEGIALGIGVQEDQRTVNPNILNATELITAAIPIGDDAQQEATGILLRSPEDLSKAFERIEADGGVTPGSLTRESGSFIRVDSVVAFTIDLMGSRGDVGSPILDNEFDLSEYMLRILAGVRLADITASTNAHTEYTFNASSAGVYHSLKIWRGTGAKTESWVLVGCTFNLTWNYSAGDKATLDVEVLADSVIYQGNANTFPALSLSDPASAYGNQTGAAPILENAEVIVNGVTQRGFQTGTLTIAYPVNEVQDTRFSGGIRKSQGTPREVKFEAVFFADDDTPDGQDFDFLEEEFDGNLPGPVLEFQLGVTAVPNGIANALRIFIPSWRVESTDKVDGDHVLRTITGYGARRGTDAVFGTGANEEFRLRSV